MNQSSRLYFSISIFLFLYFIIITIRPSMIFDKKNNCLRQFGVGYQNTSVMTLWLFTLLLAIVSYFSVYYVDYLHDNIF